MKLQSTIVAITIFPSWSLIPSDFSSSIYACRISFSFFPRFPLPVPTSTFARWHFRPCLFPPSSPSPLTLFSLSPAPYRSLFSLSVFSHDRHGQGESVHLGLHRQAGSHLEDLPADLLAVVMQRRTAQNRLRVLQEGNHPSLRIRTFAEPLLPGAMRIVDGRTESSGRRQDLPGQSHWQVDMK